MSDDSLKHLVRMVNQIAENLSPASADENLAAEKVASHLKRFWARSMKAQIIDYAMSDGSELHPIAKQAVGLL